MAEIDLKQEIATQAKKTEQEQSEVPDNVKLTSNMSISDIVKALGPELKKALPSGLTYERFVRISLSALNNTPELKNCTPMSFISALLNAAQLGLEPNSPLGQAYLIPYKQKNQLFCQFQIGYKGLIDLAYRSGQIQTIQAQVVYENDFFEYEYGLNPVLVHRPAFSDRGEPVYFYGLYKAINGGFGFSVMSKAEMDAFATAYSKGIGSSYSPWKTNYSDMARKTVIKQALKYAPIKTEVQKDLLTDETIKTKISAHMNEVANEMTYIDAT